MAQEKKKSTARARKSGRAARKERKAAKERNYGGYNEDEWKRRGEHFGEEMADVGERIGRAFEHAFGTPKDHGYESRRGDWKDEWRESRKDWREEMRGRRDDWRARRYSRPDVFGPLSPLIRSVVGLVFVLLALVALDIVNGPLQSPFIKALSGYVFANLDWVFAVFLFFGYADYFSVRFWKAYWAVSPVVNAIGFVLFLWIAMWSLNIVGSFAGNDALMAFSNIIYVNIANLFWLVVVIGYMFVLSKKFVEQSRRRRNG